jgi:tetratricopeptide (TPR) repeat protein
VTSDKPNSENANPENIDLAKSQYEAGKAAFERGLYRQSVERLQEATKLVSRATALGGEIQMWLVTAYQASGQDQEAIALCEALGKHPDLKTRQQSRNVLYILKAPKLETRPEWLTQIPDLTALEGSTDSSKGRAGGTSPRTPTRPRPQPEAEPVDLSKVNTQDNGFVWVALGAIALVLAALFGFGIFS